MTPAPETPEAQAFRRVFEATYDDLTRFVERRAEPVAVRPWLFRVAHNVLANTNRGSRRARALAVRVAAQPREDDGGDSAEVVHRVDAARAFARLSTRDQEALALVAWEGLTTAEAAAVLGVSPTAFSVRLSRARRRLRAHLRPTDEKGDAS